MNALITTLAALGPLLLLVPGLVPAAMADGAPRRMRRAVTAAAAAASALAAAAAIGLALTGRAIPGTIIHLDSVSATMLVLVSAIGAVVADYSRRYLDGDPGQGRFMKWLALTLAAVLALVVAGNLALLAVAWVATSLCLHRLLVFYGGRPGAVLAARKKFIAARAGDAALLAAILIAWQVFGTLEIAGVRSAAAELAGRGEAGLAIHAVALLLAVAAILKSAQFPAHGWLVEVMETPTPVSALLHAGIVNAGGYLIVRMADVVALSAGALDALLVVGATTAVVGAAVMLTQTSVKVSLAWSTVAQMGFMVMQLGLGAFAAALLHIVAHALYKANAFLSSGGVVAARRPERLPPLPKRVLLPALAGAVAIVLAVGAALGMPATEALGPAVLGSVLVMALVPTLATAASGGSTAFALRAWALAGVVAVLWFALQSGASLLFGPALPEATAPRSALALVLSVLAVLAFAALLVLNVARRSAAPGRLLGALYVHLLNGLYVNAALNARLARPMPRGVQ
jgi:NAD(P)H-quinone oxidoreductase subunit 5